MKSIHKQFLSSYKEQVFLGYVTAL